MTKSELKKLIKQVLNENNENQTNRQSIVSGIIDKLAAAVRSNPNYKEVTTSKFGENMVGYLKNGYNVAFIIDDPNKIRVQLHDENDDFVSKKTFNSVADAIEVSKDPMVSLSGFSKANIPGLEGSQVMRAMKSSDGKVHLQLSNGKTIWDAVLK